MRRVSLTAALLAVLAGCNMLWGVDELAIDDPDSTVSSGTGASTSASSGPGGGGPCEPTLTECLGECVDLSSNNEHCGDCDRPCATGEICLEGSCECTNGIICAEQCIDPSSSSLYCGASDDCEGNNAGEMCGPSASCDNGVCVQSLINGSFENDLIGWDVSDVPDPYLALAVTGPGVTGGGGFNLFSSDPTDGDLALLHGFDGEPGTIEVGQNITLAPMSQAILHFDYRVGWEFLQGNAQPRTFDIRIEPPGGGPPIETQTVLVATPNNNTPDTGPQTWQQDLSAYAGQTIYLRFHWTVPEDYTGPALFQLDNIRILAAP